MLPNGFVTEFRSLPPVTKEKFFLEHDEGYQGELDRLLRQFGNKDAFLSVFAFKDENDIDNCDIIGPAYLDFDSDISTDEKYLGLVHQVKRVLSVLVNTWKISKDMIRIYFSGYKGFHVIIHEDILGIKPGRDINSLYKGLAMYFRYQFNADSIDLKIYDRRRILRIPGTVNRKTGLYKVPVSLAQLYSFSREEMLEWAKEPREENVAAPKFTHTAADMFSKTVMNIKPAEKKVIRKRSKEIPDKKYYLGPCLKTLLATSIPKGNRNNTCVTLASSLMQHGYQPEEVRDILYEWNDRNAEPLPRREVDSTISSAHNMLGVHNYGRTSYEEMGVCVGGKLSCYECKKLAMQKEREEEDNGTAETQEGVGCLRQEEEMPTVSRLSSMLRVSKLQSRIRALRGMRQGQTAECV